MNFSQKNEKICFRSDEMIDMNNMVKLALSFDKKKNITLKHIPGPQVFFHIFPCFFMFFL